MKCAIVTVFYNTNYGAVLQAYALSKTIEKLTNSECYLIDYRREKIRNMFRFSLFDVGMDDKIRITFDSLKRTVKQCINPKGTIIRFKKFEDFRKEHMSISDEVYYKREQINFKDINILFLGSDQIWNPDITQGFDDVYFGKINNSSIFTVSYAASLGKTIFSDAELFELKQLINYVDIISVREEEGAEVIRQLTDREIICVPDPTVLVDRKSWLKIAAGTKKIKKKYIMVYMLEYSQVLVDLAYQMSEKYKCEIILFDSGLSKPIKRMKQKKACGPNEFIRYLADAEFVITNSFHGTVFSVIFHKQFYTIPHKTKGSRMINFCNKLDLDNRIIDESRNINSIEIEKQIDYSLIQLKLDELKQVGFDFIKGALKEIDYE